MIKAGGCLTGPNLPSHPNGSVLVTTNTDRLFSVPEVNEVSFEIKLFSSFLRIN